MKRTCQRAKWGILAIASLLFASMLACQAGAGQAPTVQLTFPPTGSQVAVGDVVPIHSTAQDDRGVTSVELWVAGQLLETTTAPGNPRTFAAVQQWTPPQAGVFNVGVRAYDSDGQVSEPALVTVEVVVTAAEVTQPLPEEPAAPTQAPQPTTGPSGQPSQGPSEQPTQTPLSIEVASPPAFATVGGGPDLECSNWRYEGFPDPVVVGQPVALEVIIWNSGNLQAFNFRWGVQPASPAMEYMESQETISLNGNQDGSFFWQGDPIVYNQAGQYSMLIMVDLHDAVDEVDENNNQCQGQITVAAAAEEIASAAVSFHDYQAGGWATFGVENTGTVALESVHLVINCGEGAFALHTEDRQPRPFLGGWSGRPPGEENLAPGQGAAMAVSIGELVGSVPCEAEFTFFSQNGGQGLSSGAIPVEFTAEGGGGG